MGLSTQVLRDMIKTNIYKLVDASDQLLDMQHLAVHLEKTISNHRDSNNDAFVEKVCFHNVEVQMERILKRSSLLTEMIEKKEIGLVGAVYNLVTGEVEFDQNHIHI